MAEGKKKKSATWLAMAKISPDDVPGGIDGWRIAAEGRSIQECQRAVEVTGAGVEHMFCRVELIAGKRTTTPRQVLLWGAPRGRRPKVAATSGGLEWVDPGPANRTAIDAQADDLGVRMPSET